MMRVRLINIIIEIWLLLKNITNCQNIYGLCNKMKKSHYAGHSFKIFQIFPSFLSSFFSSSSAIFFSVHRLSSLLLSFFFLLLLLLVFFKLLFGSRSCIKYKRSTFIFFQTVGCSRSSTKNIKDLDKKKSQI